MLHLLAVILIILGNAADYASTLYGLKHGAHELNPLLVRFGILNVKLAETAALSAVALFALNPLPAVALGLIILAGYAGIAWHNLRAVKP